MSKVGIAARITAIVAAAELANPMAARVYRLPPALRLRYDLWCSERARIDAEAGGPAAAFEAYLNGEIEAVDPPKDVADALQFNRVPVLTEAMSVSDCARAYDEFKGT